MPAPTETNDFGQCFGTLTDKAHYQQTDLSQTWRLWQFQVCTQWGFFTVRIISSSDDSQRTSHSNPCLADSPAQRVHAASRLQPPDQGVRRADLHARKSPPFPRAYSCSDPNSCGQAYPPGDHFSIPQWPNVTDVNKLGGFNIAADRLAIIDGQADPWRGDTPHSPDAPNRTDTTLRPFKLIPSAYNLFGVLFCLPVG